jgi:hypothetical protein
MFTSAVLSAGDGYGRHLFGTNNIKEKVLQLI